MMPKASQIASLGQHSERIDRTDPGYRTQKLVIGMLFKQFGSACLNGSALLDQAASLGKDKAEHPDGIRFQCYGQANGSL